MSRQSARRDEPLDLLLEPSTPDEPEDRRAAFDCDVEGLTQAVSGSAIQHEQEAAPLPSRPMDVLRYPMNLDGLARMVILALALWAVHRLIALVYPYRAVVLLGASYVVTVGYAALYFSYCVFDSSKGGTCAPAISPVYTPDKSDLRSQLLLLAGGVALCFGPAALYRVFAGVMDLRFWVLAFVGAFYLPMTLLTGSFFDGLEALNPVLIVRSIAATLPAYLGLVVRLALLLSPAFVIHWISWRHGLPPVFFYAAYLYLLWGAGHLLGRFYLRQRDKLQWGL